MEEVKKLLETRTEYLLELKREKEKALSSVPDGSLRINNSGKRPQYFLRNNPKDFTGIYIRDENFQFVQQLAQKDYDKKVLKAIQKELGAIEKFHSHYPKHNAEQIMETLHKERQKLITPVVETKEQFLKRWQDVSYQGKPFYDDAPELYTAKGERVRSKSEIIIADLLGKEGVPYHYEYPLYLKGFGKVYPDFKVLNVKKRKEIYWEHFGRMDDLEYVEKTLRKIALYEQNGIFPGEGLILTFETGKVPINQKLVKLMIEYYLT